MQLIDFPWNLKCKFSVTTVKIYWLPQKYRNSCIQDLQRDKHPPSLCSTPKDWEEHTFVSLPHHWWPYACWFHQAHCTSVCLHPLSLLSGTHKNMTAWIYVCVYIGFCTSGGANSGNSLRLWGLTDFVPKVFASFSLVLHTNLLRLRRTDLMAMTRKSGSKCNPKRACSCVCHHSVRNLG